VPRFFSLKRSKAPSVTLGHLALRAEVRQVPHHQLRGRPSAPAFSTVVEHLSIRSLGGGPTASRGSTHHGSTETDRVTDQSTHPPRKRQFLVSPAADGAVMSTKQRENARRRRRPGRRMVANDKTCDYKKRTTLS